MFQTICYKIGAIHISYTDREKIEVQIGKQLIKAKSVASAKRLITKKMKTDEVKEAAKYYINEALIQIDRAYYSDYEDIKTRLEIIENKLNEAKTFLN